jgi:hypothetical protein
MSPMKTGSYFSYTADLRVEIALGIGAGSD